MLAIGLLGFLLAACQSSAGPGLLPLGGDVFRPPAQRVQASLNHEVYLATPRRLSRLRPTAKGLEALQVRDFPEESPIALAVSPQAVCLWRDWERFYWDRQLNPMAKRFVDLNQPYLQGQMCALPAGFLYDEDRLLRVSSAQGEVRGELELPGYVEQMWVQDGLAYILDPERLRKSLLRVDVSQPDQPVVLEQVEFSRGPELKGSQWLDLDNKRWYVLQGEQMLVFDSDHLGQGPIGRVPGLPPLTALPDDGRFRLWKHTPTPPLWALGRDRELVLARLELTRKGLRVAERLPLQGFRFPLMSAPFVERAGSRLYASDGGGLWIVDLAGPKARLLASQPFRYGLTLATAPSWLPPSSSNSLNR